MRLWVGGSLSNCATGDLSADAAVAWHHGEHGGQCQACHLCRGWSTHDGDLRGVGRQAGDPSTELRLLLIHGVLQLFAMTLQIHQGR